MLIERLRDRAAGFDAASRAAVETLIEALVADRETVRGEMLATLGSDRYTMLLRRLAAVSKPLPITVGSAAGPALVELVCSEYRRMCKAAQRAGEDSPDEVLHALRIYGKRLRYTSELAATAGRKPVRRLVASTVALQDLLGEHQDACVAQHRVRQLLNGLGDVVDFDVAFAAGRLVERLLDGLVDQRRHIKCARVEGVSERSPNYLAAPARREDAESGNDRPPCAAAGGTRGA